MKNLILNACALLTIGASYAQSAGGNLNLSQTNQLALPDNTLPSIQGACSKQNFVLIELFTSEGCSSCPTADTYFNSLYASNKNNNVLMLAHHITYWNGTLPSPSGSPCAGAAGAWVDPMSSTVYTSWQNAYVSAFSSPYNATPEFILQGDKSTVITSTANPHYMSASIFNTASGYFSQSSTHGVCLEPVSIDTTTNSISVKYTILGSAHNGTERLVIATYEDSLSNYVNKGENCGLTLHHQHVTRSLYNYTVNASSDTTGTVSISYPSVVKDKNAGVLAFVQNKTTMKALGGTKGFSIPEGLNTIATVSINEPSAENSTVYVYPNPAKNNVSFTFKGEVNFNDNVSIDIFDLKGAKVKTIGNINNKTVTIDVDKALMPAGVYMFTVQSDKAQYQTGKLVVE